MTRFAMPKYQVRIEDTDGRVSWLEHRGRISWSLKTARKHRSDILAGRTGIDNKSVRYVVVEPAP